MITRKLFVGTCIVFAALTSQAKEPVEVRIKLNSSTEYTRQSPTVFIGKTDTVSVSMQIKGTDGDGKVQMESFGPMEASEVSTDKLTIQGDSLVSENTAATTVVKAAITPTEMRVSSSEILRSTGEALKAKGKVIISGLDLKTPDSEVGFQLNVSDLVCKTAEPTVCTLSVEMIFQGER